MYRWKPQSMISADANEIGAICEELAAKAELNPETLLDKAKDKKSPLHDLFEWDDTVAAEKYRIIQARHLIANLTIVGDGKTETRAFVRCTQTAGEYTSMSVCMRVPELTERLLQQAYKDMSAFQRKYKTLERLVPVFNAIEEVFETA